jgi:hypothetical protein
VISLPLPTVLYLYFLDNPCLIKKFGIRRNTLTKMVQLNAHAGDVVIISRNPKALEEAVQEIHNTAQEIELII